MKQLFLKSTLALLLIVFGAMQANADQGPWKHYGMRYGWWSSDHSRSYNAQDQSLWGGSWAYHDDVNGMHWYNYSGTSGNRYMQSFHMIAYLTYSTPSYSRVVKTYVYDIYSHTTQYYLTTNVLFFDDLASAQTTGVSLGQNVKDSRAHGYFYNNATGSSFHASADFYATFTFDNRSGSGNKDISKYLLLVNCATNKGKDKRDITHESGFRHRYYGSETWYYYKHITYYPNGGSGSNQTQTIENSGTLKAASTYTRKNHIFKGWYTAASSGTYYAAGATFTVNSSNKGTMNLYAQWTPVQFTFKNGSTTMGSANAQSTNALPSLNANYKPTAGTNQFFCGYYTQAGGKGIQVYDSNLKPTTAGQNQNFTANTTLYAHFITTQHTATWDYTYRSDDNVYVNLDDHNRFCRLQFKDVNGTVFKTVYLTAPEVTNVQNPTSSNHTTAKVVVDLAVATATDITNDGNAKIYFTQAQLESMRGYQFDVWTTDGTTTGAKAAKWVTTTNPSAHTTLFTFGQLSDNMFMLKWEVTLHNLMMYPDKIYAKPMILVNGNYVEIDQMTGMLGEDCHIISRDISRTDVGANSSRTYYGEFPVLKNQTGGTLANYKVGMTGFYLAGGNYFLHANQGQVSNDFISTAAGLQYQDDTQDQTKNTITYNIYDYDIPVVLLLPANPTLGATDASINYLDKVLYVDQARAKKVNLSQFVAERPHFNFLGWYDAEMTAATSQKKVWGADEDYYFYTHTSPYGGTRTLIALWDRDSDPEASIEMTDETGNFTYTITATDEVEVKAVKYLIQDSTAAAPTANTTGWKDVTSIDGNQYHVDILRKNQDYGKVLYVLVQNETRSIILKADKPIRSFWDISANPDPDSKDQDGNYTYYSTFYDSYQSYKLNGDANASVVASVDGGNLVINPLSSNAHGEVIIRKGTAVILSGAMDKLPLELVSEAYVALGDTPIEEVDKTEVPQGETPQGENEAPARLVSEVPAADPNILEGVDDPTSPDEANYTYYVLSYAQNGLGFYVNVTGRELAAHKAYFTLDGAYTAAAPRAFVFDLSDAKNPPVATAIENAEAETLLNGPVYNIYGQMVAPSLEKADNLANGIYIVGGQKVVINK